MKQASRLFLALLLLLVAFLSRPARVEALTCQDCISLCLLSHCGFITNPPCQAMWSTPCRTGQCASSCH